MEEEEDLFTTEEWMKLLKEQADITREYRHSLYEKVDIKNKKNILDVGCGTGIITADIASLTDGCITGIDIDGKKLEQATPFVSDPHITLVEGDALQLPFKNKTFDLVVSNVVLIHVKDQQKAVDEMVRVTCKNGIVLAALEPDYAGGLCYPKSDVHSLSLQYLKKMHVDVTTGRKLKYLFRKAGLKTEIGQYSNSLDVINKENGEQIEEFLKEFWSTKKVLLNVGWTEEQIEEYKQEEIELLRDNLIFSFLPAFYAIGRK